MKTMFAESTIYYISPSGMTRMHYRKGPFRTNSKNTETARAAYAKYVRHSTAPRIIEQMHHMNIVVLDPTDPRDRWILESDGSEETARILAQCDEENTAAGHTIPRASFLPPAI